MKLKICVVGERAVGKTSLILRYVYNTFDDAYHGTLGAKLHLIGFTKRVAVNDLVEAQVALFDYMGEGALRDAFRDAMFWGAHGFLAMSDLTRPDTLYALPDWINSVVGVAGDVPYVVVLNKSDLVRHSTVGPTQTEWLLRRLPQAPLFLTSAKTGEGVARAVKHIIERAVDEVLSKSKARHASQIVGERVLLFAQRRGAAGVTKRELLMAIKGLDPKRLEEQVENLKRLGLVAVDMLDPGNFRLVLTEAGQEAATRMRDKAIVVEEPT
jgi:small GTP-binding protein